MLAYLELLDADALHSCFAELTGRYSDLLDRSRQHTVEFMNTQENLKLASRLKDVGYITSYHLLEKSEKECPAKSAKTRSIIQCRIKAIK